MVPTPYGRGGRQPKSQPKLEEIGFPLYVNNYCMLYEKIWKYQNGY